MECGTCGAPTETVGEEFTMTGAGFGPPGTECIVTFQRVHCAAGHWYQVEVNSVELPPTSAD